MEEGGGVTLSSLLRGNYNSRIATARLSLRCEQSPAGGARPSGREPTGEGRKAGRRRKVEAGADGRDSEPSPGG